MTAPTTHTTPITPTPHTHTPTPDVAELKMILKQIDAEPETWYQKQWAKKLDVEGETGPWLGDDERSWAQELPVDSVCGTSYCFAGWAVRRAGYEFEFEDGKNYALETTGGEEIGSLAEKILGLKPGHGLFSMNNEYSDLVRIVGEIEADTNRELSLASESM